MEREYNVLQTDNTQLRANFDEMQDEIIKQKDEIGKLIALLDSQSSEIAQLKVENQQLKVSQLSMITRAIHLQ